MCVSLCNLGLCALVMCALLKILIDSGIGNVSCRCCRVAFQKVNIFFLMDNDQSFDRLFTGLRHSFVHSFVRSIIIINKFCTATPIVLSGQRPGLAPSMDKALSSRERVDNSIHTGDPTCGHYCGEHISHFVPFITILFTFHVYTRVVLMP